MRTHPMSVTGIPVVIALLTLTGCPNDPIRGSANLETAEEGYYQKLQTCGILGEGRTPSLEGSIPPGQEMVYACMLDCIAAKPCGDLRAAFCGDNEQIYEQCWLGCESPAFHCGNGEEVPADFQCDGEADCMDGSDETNCSNPTGFLCGDGTQIPADFVCDEEPDCMDGSDEAQCAPPASFRCGDGQLVSAYAVCDTYNDCSDGSDEAGCAQLMCQ